MWERLRTLVSEQEHSRQLSAMSELIKGFSHELGQPITNIRYAIQFFYMRRRKENVWVGQEEEQLLNGVLSQTERVGKLLNRFSMIFSSKSEKTYFNVYNAIHTTFDEMSSRLVNEAVHFSLNSDRNAGSVKAALELEEMGVEVAYDGEEGLNMFRNGQYDLVLLDLEMPKMNGEELLREVRKENPYIDIIVYTNYERFGDIKKLVNMGINGYVNKGLSADLQELIDMIKSKLETMDEEEMACLIQNTKEIGRQI